MMFTEKQKGENEHKKVLFRNENFMIFSRFYSRWKWRLNY
jgi:hypothetical protein